MSITEQDLSLQLQRDIEERNRKLEEARLRAAKAQGLDPERSRRILSASEATGLPAQVVEPDLENIEKQLLSQQFDPEAYKRAAPAWTQYLSENPYHMAALEDDFENMGAVERSIRQIGMGWDQSKAQVEMGLLQNERIKQGGIFTPEQESAYEKYSKMQVEHQFGADGLVGFLVKTAQFVGPTVYSMQEGVKMGAGGAIAGMSAAALAGQAGPQVATPEEVFTVPTAGVLGFKVGATVGASEAAFELERGFAYGEYRDMGMDHKTAMMGANTVGVINASLESVGIGYAVKHVPWLREGAQALSKKITGDVLTRQSVARASRNLAINFGETLGAEIVTEVLQESVTMVTGEMIRPENIGHELTMDMYLDRIADTALQTFQGAFLLSTIGPGARYYGDLRRAQQAQRMQSVFDQAAESSSKSTTRKNNRGTYQQFVQRLRDQGMTDVVYVDAERFTTYFQDKGRDADAVAADLGIEQADLEEAREIGGDVAIPVDQYADKLAPTQAGFDLAGDLKGSVDAMSAREADLWMKNNAELLKQIEELGEAAQDSAQDAQIEKVVQDVTGQLVAAGYSTRAAGQLAQIMRGIGVLARRNDMDPMALYDRIFAGVKRVTPEAKATREDVDVLIDPMLNRIRNRDWPAQREMYGPSLMDFINERGGIDPTDPELAAMDFELGARDLGVSKAKVNRWKREGGTTADLAEAAAEAGYIPENNENLLVEALRDELAGNPVFGAVDGGNLGLRDLSAKLDELATYIDEAGLDIENMTNEEVRKALEERETFAQIDLKELQNLTQMVMNEVLTAEETAQLGAPFTAESPVDVTLARAQAMLPEVAETQDFGDVTISANVRIEETGKRARVDKIPAQREFDKAVKRKNVLKRLLDCVSG